MKISATGGQAADAVICSKLKNSSLTYRILSDKVILDNKKSMIIQQE